METIQTNALLMARVGIVLMALSMPISRAVFNLGALLMLLGWVASGQWQQKWELVCCHAMAWVCTALFVAAVTSGLWTHAPAADFWDALRGYSRLLYIPIIVTLMADTRWQRWAWGALISGMTAVFGVYMADIWWEIPGTHSYGTHTAGFGVFYHHIAQSMVLNFLGAYALDHALRRPTGKGRRLLAVTMSLAVLVGMLSVGQSRTGQLSVVLAYVAVFLTHLRFRGRALGVLVTCGLAGTLFWLSPVAKDRMILGAHELITYKADGEQTSVGARVMAWEHSWTMIQRSPWLGHGAGAYPQEAALHFQDSPVCRLGVCAQPHNQFILTAFELGIGGVLLLLAFVCVPVWQVRKHRRQDLGLACALASIFVTTAFFDSSLRIQAQLFFTVTVGALLALSPPFSQDGLPRG